MGLKILLIWDGLNVRASRLNVRFIGTVHLSASRCHSNLYAYARRVNVRKKFIGIQPSPYMPNFQHMDLPTSKDCSPSPSAAVYTEPSIAFAAL